VPLGTELFYPIKVHLSLNIRKSGFLWKRDSSSLCQWQYSTDITSVVGNETFPKLCQFRDEGGLTFFVQKSKDFNVLGDGAEEQMIPAREQNSPRIFRNLDSLVCDRILRLNISRRYHDPNHRFESWRFYQAFMSRSIWFSTHYCCSKKTKMCKTYYLLVRIRRSNPQC